MIIIMNQTQNKIQGISYLPQSSKNQMATVKSLFTQKKEKLPKDNLQLHREKFRQQLKNKRK